MTEHAFSTISIVLAITCAGFGFVMHVTLQAVQISHDVSQYDDDDDY